MTDPYYPDDMVDALRYAIKSLNPVHFEMEDLKTPESWAGAFTPQYETMYGFQDEYGNFIWEKIPGGHFDPTKQEVKCECGAHKVGSNHHSNYCPQYEI